MYIKYWILFFVRSYHITVKEEVDSVVVMGVDISVLLLHAVQAVQVHTGALAQEECWVPAAAAEECWEQRWVQGECSSRG